MIAGLVGGAALAQEKSSMFADAQAYDRFMGRWSALVAPLFVDFAAISGAGHVLDAGSGTGSLAHAIAERIPKCRVTGIDPSSEYVAYARSQAGSDRIHFETGDAQQMGFANGAFDHSLSLLVFNFIPDPRKALAEVRRVTKPGGKIAAAVWDYGKDMQMLRVFWDAAVALDPAAEKLDEKHMPLCRAGELSELWKQGMLQNVEERPIDIAMKFASFADFWDPFLLGQGPAGAYVAKVQSGKRPRLAEEVKRRLMLASDTAAFTLKGRVWAVRGVVPRQG
jgi:SAM-dependent methyltransferase